MKKKGLIVLFFTIVLCLSFLTPNAWAGRKHGHRLTGIAIRVGIPILPPPIHYYPEHPGPAIIYYPPPPPRPCGHWEIRTIWVPPAYDSVWNPGHYDGKCEWVPGRWVKILREPGYWLEERVWVNEF